MTEPALTGSEGEPPPPKGAILGRKQLEFLATKLVPPRCEGLIPRPRLLDMASQLSRKRLAVIKAPAGSAKRRWLWPSRKNFNRAEMLSGG